ncbi:MAG TPA: DUF1802 family protein [Chthoniobacterales bacterium]|jgi:hypothetical protein
MMIGFKEWALVCAALEAGTTSLMIRKGGIAEGREGFRFKHDAFVLFPTLFHEQLAKTRLPAETAMPVSEEGVITIRARATVEWTQLITDRALLEKLAPHHILQPSVVEERFVYDPKPGQTAEPDGVNVAFLRVWKADRPWQFPDAPKYGGCRSWVELPKIPPEISWTPAFSDEAHAARSAELKAIWSS